MTGANIFIIGGGPTGLGAAVRLSECGHQQWHLAEKTNRFGGLATFVRDEQGYLWDRGIHIVFSHYKYFDEVVEKLGPEAVTKQRVVNVVLKKGKQIVPYPFQNNIDKLTPEEQLSCLDGLLDLQKGGAAPPKNFEEWMVQSVGRGICDIFLRPYNYKLWRHPATEMNATWVGERVAVTDIRTVLKKCLLGGDKIDNWGPNATFKYPKEEGTGNVWKHIGESLESSRVDMNVSVVGIDATSRTVELSNGSKHGYDYLVSTLPLPVVCKMIETSDPETKKYTAMAERLKYTTTHIVGLVIKGTLPEVYRGVIWAYMPDSDSDWYRVTFLTELCRSFCHNHEDEYMLMFEVAESQALPYQHSVEEMIKRVSQQTVDYGMAVSLDAITSTHHELIHFGYPVPSIERDEIVASLHQYLESHHIISRGRFGSWKYEVGNQDHSFMQGVEAADWILSQLEGNSSDNHPFAAQMTLKNPSFTNTNRSEVPFAGLKHAAGAGRVAAESNVLIA